MRPSIGRAKYVELTSEGILRPVFANWTNGVSLSIPTWNQIWSWLQEMDSMRRAVAVRVR